MFTFMVIGQGTGDVLGGADLFSSLAYYCKSPDVPAHLHCFDLCNSDQGTGLWVKKPMS